ncbi:MAG: PQQ-dependent sugar dehydrogenase [Pseudomonadota bacterium]
MAWPSQSQLRAFLAGALIAEICLIAVIEFAPITLGSPPAPPPPMDPVPTHIVSALYPISVRSVSAPFDPGNGGAVAVLEGPSLLVTRTGALYRLEEDEAGYQALALPPPFENTVDPSERFAQWVGARDLLIREAGPDTAALFVSYSHYDPAEACFEVRLATTTVARDALEPSSAPSQPAWRILFSTDRCVPMQEGLIAFESGGALAALPDGRIAMTVGSLGLGFDGRRRDTALSRKPDTQFGKVLSIDPMSGETRILSIGHRNQDGLAVDLAGTLWAVEHGPRGGDELNRIVPGSDFGWPDASYGTLYGKFVQPADPRVNHSAFEKPVFAWVPSVAPSGMALARGEMFSLWEGDLLITTLASRQLLRVRLEQGRVVLVEPIGLGTRLRDVAVDEDGSLLVKVDEEPRVLRLRASAEQQQEDAGPLVMCVSCHQLDRGPQQAGLSGPPLGDVWQRAVAGYPGYAYSAALARIDEVWTADNLRNYLNDPAKAVPGTAMPSLAMQDWEVRAAIRALQRLSKGGRP